jgi:peptidoglycan/LPS O-acetylase OafA/YrhL
VKYANIQVLRFFAAFSVLLYHLGVYAKRLLAVDQPAVDVIAHPAFAIGVVVFFAISGFVLTHSLQTTSVRQFLSLRLARIYPAYWVAVVAVLALHWGLGQSTRPNMPLLKGLLLIPVGPGKAAYALGVEWSLVYEMFFYFALCLFALAGPHRGILFGTLTWFGMCLVRIVLDPLPTWLQFPTWTNIAFSPVNTPFLCGVLAYYLRHHVAAFRLWAPVFVPTLIAVSYQTPRADLMILAQGLGGGLLVGWAAATPPAGADHPLVRYGDFSYGVYLIHVPMIIFLFSQGSAHQWFGPTLGTVTAVGAVTLVVGLLYGCAEAEAYRRFRRWLMKPQRREETNTPTVQRQRAA